MPSKPTETTAILNRPQSTLIPNDLPGASDFFGVGGGITARAIIDAHKAGHQATASYERRDDIIALSSALDAAVKAIQAGNGTLAPIANKVAVAACNRLLEVI